MAREQPDTIVSMSLAETIANYQMTDQTRELVRSTPLLLVAGVVSAGKDTTINELLKDDSYYNLISHTTRSPRKNHGVLELNDQDYYFITLAEAEKMVSNNAFVEVKYVHDNVYGTSAQELRNATEQQKLP